jgi:hypothetical protein
VNNELIVLEQLPIIKVKLEQVSTQIKEKVDNATSLIVNEDTVKEVKKVRADLNKEFSELEGQRKQVKSAIMSKYDEFEEIYKEKVANLYKDADLQLKEKIDNVENELKSEKEEELIDFFEEHQKANHLENLIEFSDIGLNITISASMKSLKDQIKTFCEKVANDIKAMKTDEYQDEIWLEYKNVGFDYAKAKTNVVERHKKQEEFKQQIAKNGEEIKQDEIIVHNIETMVSAPVEVVEEKKDWYEFSVLMTQTQAKELKQWLKDKNIEMR